MSPTAPSPRKQSVIDLYRTLGSDPSRVSALIDTHHYLRHPQRTGDDLAGFDALAFGEPRAASSARAVRVLEDGDTIAVHSEYTGDQVLVGFDVFRFDGDRIVEHWDNLQVAGAPTEQGWTMTDGPTEPQDLGATEANKSLVRDYTERVFIGGDTDALSSYLLDPDTYRQHNLNIGGDGIEALGRYFGGLYAAGTPIAYHRVRSVYGEGDLVLEINDGSWGDRRVAFYDLFRVESGKIAEHWDVLEDLRDTADATADAKFGPLDR